MMTKIQSIIRLSSFSHQCFDFRCIWILNYLFTVYFDRETHFECQLTDFWLSNQPLSLLQYGSLPNNKWDILTSSEVFSFCQRSEFLAENDRLCLGASWNLLRRFVIGSVSWGKGKEVIGKKMIDECVRGEKRNIIPSSVQLRSCGKSH